MIVPHDVFFFGVTVTVRLHSSLSFWRRRYLYSISVGDDAMNNGGLPDMT